MQRQKSKSKKSKTNRRKYRSEYSSYQKDSPLTQHYLTTGAILPEKKKV
tara:strand:- start:680 stop:826 length:147 start_codon:yes stop_codon:yes gene_type:complete